MTDFASMDLPALLPFAENGDAEAQFFGAKKYYFADTPDYDQAAAWYKKSAEQGNCKAKNNLAYLYEKGHGVDLDPAKALGLYLEAAEECEIAQLNLGHIYHKGEIIEKDYSEAFQWYSKAAVRGNSEALLYVADYYRRGLGIDPDPIKAIEFDLMAADQGDANAQTIMGVAYYSGDRGVPQDYAKAFDYFRQSAEQGNPWAQHNLAFCYYLGHGADIDYAKAVEWNLKSANQNYTEAQYMMGVLYTHGHGVEPSSSEAAKWFIKSANQGDIDLQYELGELHRSQQA